MMARMDEDATLVVTRRSLHAIAEQVISPLRVQATGNEIALTVRPGGFGTPDLPGGGWVGVSGTDVVRADGEDEPITSLRAAAYFVGLEAESAAALPDDALEVHAGAASVLADAWAIGQEALAIVVAGATPRDDVSEIHLWPEHFDIAIDFGAKTVRATYGISPGDDDHPEPYAYVAPWNPPTHTGDDTFWNATGFTGAERPVADDVDEMVAFFHEAHRMMGR
jgi:hypothetical protein